jgi:hypothetical protein
MQPDLILGEDEFRQSDPSRSWSDNGLGHEVVEAAIAHAMEGIKRELSEQVTGYGAGQVRDAILDYVGNGIGQVAVIDGKAHFVLDASSEEVDFRACWDIKELVERAIQQAEGKGDVAFLQVIGQMIGSLSHNFRAPVTQAAPATRGPARPAPRPAGSRLGARPRPSL